MSAVAVAIGVGAVTGVVGEESGAAFKLSVGGSDTSVDHVSAGSCTGSVVVGVRSASSRLVRDTSKTPGG